MSRAHPLLQSFNAGELSPWLHARTAFTKYPFGLAKCENLIPIIEGAITRRSGTRYVAETKDSTKKSIMKGFVFSTVQAYMLEIGEGYIRFYRHQGQIVVTGVAGWLTATAYVVGDLRVEGGVNYYCEEAHTSGVFATDLAANKWHTLTTDIYEIPNPYAEADLADLRFVQSADVLYIFHPDYAPRKLTRSDHTDWALTIPTVVDGPYLDVNTTATTLTPSATTGSVTITASAITGINNDTGFQTTDVGRLVRLSNPASATDWSYGTITARASTTSVTVLVSRDFKTTNATVDWALGSWSDTTGFPRVGVFFQQRLVVAGTTSQPQTIWASQTDNFENFAPDSDDGATPAVWAGTVEDDDAIARTISADEVNAVVWLASLRQLVIGTSGGEWVLSSTGVTITPSDVQVIRNTKVGCASTQPVIVGNRVIFLQLARRKIMEIGFSFDDDSYRDSDLSRLARHITYGGISSMFYSRDPYSIVGCIKEDGTMACMTYNREEEVVSWFPVTTDGLYESADTIPGADGAGQFMSSRDRTEVWTIVNRTVDSAVVRYVEFFERDFETGDAQTDAYYSDSMFTYDSTPATSITGLDHLEGKAVSVWADGYIVTGHTVASGAITLAKAASVVQIGLPYTHKFKSLKLDFGDNAGSAVGKVKTINGLVFVLLNSHKMKYGPDADNLLESDFREVSDAMDTAVPLFTGEFPVDFDGGVARDARIYIEDDAPAPFTLLAIAPEMSTHAIN